MNSIKQLQDFNVVFEPLLKDYFLKKRKEIQSLSPVVKEALERIEKLTLAGGKRLRPALLYYSYKAFGGKSLHDIKNYALAIEILHSWALIHDDIMDNARIRRGKPTVIAYYERKYKNKNLGTSLAILCGDIALSWADELFYSSSIGNERLSNIFSILKNEVIYGQLMDIGKVATEKEIVTMVELKTARYTVEKPLRLGALLARADDSLCEILGSIGIKIGIAFQIQDDILGIFGNKILLGKSILSDLKEGKMNLLVIKTLQKLNLHDKKRFLSLWGNPQGNVKDLKEVQQMIKSKGGWKSCITYYNNLVKDIKKEIKGSRLPLMLQKLLLNIVDFNSKRQT